MFLRSYSRSQMLWRQCQLPRMQTMSANRLGPLRSVTGRSCMFERCIQRQACNWSASLPALMAVRLLACCTTSEGSMQSASGTRQIALFGLCAHAGPCFHAAVSFQP